MSRIVKIQDSSYKLSVSNNGTITLDTGNQVGEVIITGNLTVLGTQTTVETTNLDIEDNIITLNKGETGDGVTEIRSGVQIDRGTFEDAQFFFDESLLWRNLQSGGSGVLQNGVFVVKTADGALSGIKTASISTNGSDLSLLGEGTNVITVVGTTDYEEQVIDYTSPGYPAIDDDIIPNIKAVIDYTNAYFITNPPYKLQDSTKVGSTTTLYDSILEIHDSDADGGSSNLTLTLDGAVQGLWTTAKHEVQDLRIEGATITCLAEGTDLVLTNPGSGSIKVDDDLKLGIVTEDPAVAVDGVKLYAKDEAFGGTGVFFVNTKETRDELISRRKAIAYSMIF